MEKIRPIDQKLKYQIDKLIKIATTGLIGMRIFRDINFIMPRYFQYETAIKSLFQVKKMIH